MQYASGSCHDIVTPSKLILAAFSMKGLYMLDLASEILNV